LAWCRYLAGLLLFCIPWTVAHCKDPRMLTIPETGCTAAVKTRPFYSKIHISGLEPTPTIRDNRVHGETWFGGIGCGEHRSPFTLTRCWDGSHVFSRNTLDPNRYDAVFQRMWEYYLCCGIAAARASDAAVYQVLFHNDRAGDIPLKRVRTRLKELA
jgi:hypothetical protein